MNKIKCLSRGYYDTNNEKCALIVENSILEVLKEQEPAPCRGKLNKGVWAQGFCENSRQNVTVFIEKENFELVE